MSIQPRRYSEKTEERGGAKRWRTQPGGSIGGNPAYYEGTIYVTDEFSGPDGSLFVVDTTSGAIDHEDTRPTVWVGDMVMSGAAIDTDTETVYIGSHDQNCYALDAVTGEEVWRFETGGWITGCPTVTAKYVLVGSYDGTLYALAKESSTEVWRMENEGWITCEPLVHDGAVYYTERATEEAAGGIYRLVPA